MESSSKQERFANFSLINRHMHFIPLPLYSPPSHSLSFPSRLDKLLKCHASLSNCYNLIVQEQFIFSCLFCCMSGLNQSRGNKKVVQPTCLTFNQFLSSRLIKLFTLRLSSSGFSFGHFIFLLGQTNQYITFYLRLSNTLSLYSLQIGQTSVNATISFSF